MILSDREIRDRLNDDLKVSPAVDDEQIQPASLDVRIGNELYDPMTEEYYELTQDVEVPPDYPLLVQTMDKVELPNDLAAQLTGRSSVGRQGVIVHKTAGWIDPGFRGSITLELYNFSSSPVTFQFGQRVAQLVFFQLGRPSTGYDGQYQDQIEPRQ